MPGAVIRLGAALGDTVTVGQPLVWLEAMKMEHTITAPADGVVTQLNVCVGQQVDVGTVLAPGTARRQDRRRTVTVLKSDTGFIESAERQELRKAVAALA